MTVLLCGETGEADGARTGLLCWETDGARTGLRCGQAGEADGERTDEAAAAVQADRADGARTVLLCWEARVRKARPGADGGSDGLGFRGDACRQGRRTSG